MSPGTWFENKLDSFKDNFEFRLENIILNLTEDICKSMEQKSINRLNFAKLLNVSPPAVTKLLNGNSNFTLKTLLTVADALDLDLEIGFKEKESVITKKPNIFYETTCYAYSDEELIDVPSKLLNSVSSYPSNITPLKRLEEAA